MESSPSFFLSDEFLAYDTGADGPVGGCPNIEGQPGVACMAPCPGDYRYQYGVFGMYPDVVRLPPFADAVRGERTGTSSGTFAHQLASQLPSGNLGFGLAGPGFHCSPTYGRIPDEHYLACNPSAGLGNQAAHSLFAAAAPDFEAAGKMSAMFEDRPYIDGSYPAMDDPQDHADPRDHSDPAVDVGRLVDGDMSADMTSLAAAAANYTAVGPPSVLSDGEARLDLDAPLPDRSRSPGGSPEDSLRPRTPMRPREPRLRSRSPLASPVRSPRQRAKAPIKPNRYARKNGQGYYDCAWPDCKDETKTFTRKCEWNKHMDKHERPYRCLADGCEKLSGFTYAGGLLRHEREVHNKHGGPKNALHCPHLNCKRHSGKGFSRLENLSEHLRRVHTGNGMAEVMGRMKVTCHKIISQRMAGEAVDPAHPSDMFTDSVDEMGDEVDEVDEAEDAVGEMVDEEAVVAVASSPVAKVEPEATVAVAAADEATTSNKRKRTPDGDSGDLREEIKRVRQENQELREQIEAQTQQTVTMMQQIHQLQQALAPRIQPAPEAHQVPASLSTSSPLAQLL